MNCTTHNYLVAACSWVLGKIIFNCAVYYILFSWEWSGPDEPLYFSPKCTSDGKLKQPPPASSLPGVNIFQQNAMSSKYVKCLYVSAISHSKHILIFRLFLQILPPLAPHPPPALTPVSAVQIFWAGAGGDTRDPGPGTQHRISLQSSVGAAGGSGEQLLCVLKMDQMSVQI